MMVTERIRAILADASHHVTTVDVRIGLGYTAVQLENGNVGVAFTFLQNPWTGCSAFTGSRPLSGKPAFDLIRLLGSDNLIESAIGLAAANAIANHSPKEAVPGDVLAAVPFLPSDRVTMIGYFGPLIPILREKVQSLTIVDDQAIDKDLVDPKSTATSSLKSSQVAIITSTAIINNTIDDLIEASAGCRNVILLGSSTPNVPEAFRGTPVSYLSGITVDDSKGIMQVVSEAGGTRFFKPFTKKWNVRLRDS